MSNANHRNLARAEQQYLTPPESPEPTDDQIEVARDYLEAMAADGFDIEMTREYTPNQETFLDLMSNMVQVPYEDMRKIAELFCTIPPHARDNLAMAQTTRYAEAVKAQEDALNAYGRLRRAVGEFARAVGFMESIEECAVDDVMREEHEA